MKKILLIILSVFGLVFCNTNSRVKFYTHYGIWLPAFCNNIEFINSPDIFALVGMDGLGASAEFEIEKANIKSFIESINPQTIWLKRNDSNPTLENTSFNYPIELPKEIEEGRVSIMLYSNDTKGDYYNIWLKPKKGDIIKVTISMPFT